MGTASRALRGAPNVSPATRAKVLAVADKHAYVVSPDASRLKGGSTGRIAVVAPHLSRWFFGQMLEGLASVLRETEYDLLLYHVGSLEDRRAFFERLPARRKVDAVIVIGFPVEEAERKRLELMLDVQIVAAGGQHAVYPHVCIDDVGAGRQAVDHLIGLGHHRIAMIEAIDPEQPSQPSGRSAAYHQALAAAGISVDHDLIVTTDWGSDHGAEAMSVLLSRPQLPTAVYAHSDEVAAGAMLSIRNAGLRIPEDISVVGIDDHPIAGLLDLTDGPTASAPPRTTRRPARALTPTWQPRRRQGGDRSHPVGRPTHHWTGQHPGLNRSNQRSQPGSTVPWIDHRADRLEEAPASL